MSETENTENIGFADLGLRPELLDALMELGYEEPTPIQRESIPRLLEGRDLLGQAAPGTGKTAAFALPILERVMDSDRTAPTALVLVNLRCKSQRLSIDTAELLALGFYPSMAGSQSVDSLMPCDGVLMLSSQLRDELWII